MTRRAKVLRRMFVLRRVAAADVAATPAQAQVHPTVARLQTILAPIGARLHLAQLVEVSTLCGRHKPSSETAVRVGSVSRVHSSKVVKRLSRGLKRRAPQDETGRIEN